MYMTKNPANVLLSSSQRSVCTICVFINKNQVKSEKGQANSEWRHLAVKSASPGDQHVTLDLAIHDNY